MKVDAAFDVLLTTYAKAENVRADPDSAYGALRACWGVIQWLRWSMRASLTCEQPRGRSVQGLTDPR